MGFSSLAAAFGLLSLVAAQHPGNITENHPRLTTYQCTKAGGCKAKEVAVVLESSKRSVYQVDAPSYGCGTQGGAPNVTACPDVETCQANCVMQGVPDYSKVGVTTDGSSISLVQLDANLTKVSPRVYLLSGDDEESYEMIDLLGKELAFDVDVSKLPCGMNGALYMIEMEANGGKDEINTGGAYYGTGYCDAQCYVYPFIGGRPNIKANGACCNELDIWEANDRSTQLAPHTCNQTGLYECTGSECSKGGVCDHNGCAFNPYTQNKTFYGLGPNTAVDTSRPFTVVTQFPTNEAGFLTSFQRLYVQDGKVIQNANVSASSSNPHKVNYIDDEYCQYAGGSEFLRLGATEGMGEAMARGMVLSMSVWWSDSTMSWLDAGSAGPCNATEETPAYLTATQPDTAVTFSNIKWGEIGSTYGNCKV